MGILETVAQRAQQESLMQAKDDLLHAAQMAGNGRVPRIETILKAAVAAGTSSNAACAANARLSDQLEHLIITDALNALRTQGLISYARGKITILDRKGMERTAGEVYGIPEAEYRRLIG
jgi:hypothetical protein